MIACRPGYCSRPRQCSAELTLECAGIADTFVDLYGRNSGFRDTLVAERDVVLTCGRGTTQDLIPSRDMSRVAQVLLVVLLGGPSAADTPATAPSRAMTTSTAGSAMVLVPAGRFLRGSRSGEGADEERPQRSVHLDAFYIDRHEVSVAQYRACVKARVCTDHRLRGDPPPSEAERDLCNYGHAGRDDHPVNCVIWDEAKRYCAWAGKRLPTEAEWEKAARGTDGRRYPWGSAEPDCKRVNFGPNEEYCHDGTRPVTAYASSASPYGALQMAGNVWEWTADVYDRRYYAKSPSRNPTGPSCSSETQRCAYRVIRGGGWGSLTDRMRAASRFPSTPAERSHAVGFRCAKSAR
jgi:formylglycine-generating enzyme required for sulfatase activity